MLTKKEYENLSRLYDENELENDGMNYANGQTMKYIEKVIKDMIAEGLLIGIIDNNRSLFRSLNKSEQKKLKVKIA